MSFRIALALCLTALPGLAPADPDAPRLTFIDSTPLRDRSEGLTEPSGLSLRAAGGYWVVSDDTDRVLAINDAGAVALLSPEHAAFSDLEAVAEHAPSGRLLVLSESAAALIVTTPEDLSRLDRHRLRDMAGFPALAPRLAAAEDGDGPEGLAVRADGTVVVAFERPPLLIEVTADLSTILSVRALGAEDGFSVPGEAQDRLDVSGLSWDATREALWLLSDTGAALFMERPETDGFLRLELSIGSDDAADRLRNPEGLAVSPDGATLTVVTDDGRNSRLLRFAID